MKIISKTLMIVIIAIVGIAFVSCEKEMDTQAPELEELSTSDNESFLYKKDIKVEDESKQYYVIVSVQSNSQELLDIAIQRKPYITVSNISSSLSNSLENYDNISDNLKNLGSGDDIMYIATKDRNIPKGFSYSFHMNSKKKECITTKGPGCIFIEGDHIEHATFRDDLANEIYVANHGNECGISIKIYTRGSKSWSWGWYKRLDEGFPNDYAVLLDRRNYNSIEPGIKVTAKALYDLNGLSWYVTDSE